MLAVLWILGEYADRSIVEAETLAGKRSEILMAFSGKLLLARLASKFSVPRDELARSIAKELNKTGRTPKQLIELLKEIEEKSMEKPSIGEKTVKN